MTRAQFRLEYREARRRYKIGSDAWTSWAWSTPNGRPAAIARMGACSGSSDSWRPSIGALKAWRMGQYVGGYWQQRVREIIAPNYPYPVCS